MGTSSNLPDTLTAERFVFPVETVAVARRTRAADAVRMARAEYVSQKDVVTGDLEHQMLAYLLAGAPAIVDAVEVPDGWWQHLKHDLAPLFRRFGLRPPRVRMTVFRERKVIHRRLCPHVAVDGNEAHFLFLAQKNRAGCTCYTTAEVLAERASLALREGLRREAEVLDQAYREVFARCQEQHR